MAKRKTGKAKVAEASANINDLIVGVDLGREEGDQSTVVLGEVQTDGTLQILSVEETDRELAEQIAKDVSKVATVVESGNVAAPAPEPQFRYAYQRAAYLRSMARKRRG